MGMEFKITHAGQRFTARFDASSNTGTLLLDGATAPWSFTYAFGDDTVVWKQPSVAAAFGPEFGASLALHLFAQERLGTVEIAPRGWATVVTFASETARRRVDLCPDPETHHVHRVCAEIVQRSAVGLPEGSEVVVLEEILDAQHAHPVTRARHVGLNRPLYGRLVLHVRVNGVPCDVPWRALHALAALFNELPGVERVAQCARYLSWLRARDARWGDVQHAERALREATETFDADQIGAVPRGTA